MLVDQLSNEGGSVVISACVPDHDYDDFDDYDDYNDFDDYDDDDDDDDA